MDIGSFITFITSGWMLIHSVFLGIVLFYWLTVIIGVLDFDMIDLDIDLDIDASEGISGAFTSLGGFLNLDRVPLTVVLSFITVKMWIIGYSLHYMIPASLQNTFPIHVLGGIIFIASFIVASLLTSVTTRPLGKLFEQDQAISNNSLIGYECKIVTGRADESFGEATLVINNDHLQLSVRADKGITFSKGEQAVIYDYNEETGIYTITKPELN